MLTYPSDNIDVTSQALQDIREAALDIAAGRNEIAWCEELLNHMNASHDRMKRASCAIELNTLRKIYTDSSIVRGLLQSIWSHSFEAIATLDSAIIIAGPFGDGRLKLILGVITNIQQLSLSYKPTSTGLLVPSIAPNIASLTCTIPCLPNPPSLLEFQKITSRGPFILRNYTNCWPALRRRPWRSSVYLRSVAGPGRIIPVEVGSDYRSDDWQQSLIPWDDFLSLLDFEDQPSSKVSQKVHYLAQHDLTRQFPALREDIILPDYLYADVVSPDYHEYRHPRNDDKMVFNTWLGPKGTISPAHVVSESIYIFTAF